MKIDVSKDWCLRMANLEGDSEIGAGGVERLIDEIKSDNERLRRLLWLIVKSNGGYTLERHDIEQWPGADKGEVVTMEDPTTGNFVFSAVTNGDTSQT